MLEIVLLVFSVILIYLGYGMKKTNKNLLKIYKKVNDQERERLEQIAGNRVIIMGLTILIGVFIRGLGLKYSEHIFIISIIITVLLLIEFIYKAYIKKY